MTILLLFLAAVAVRAQMAFAGGIWADEGLVVNILAIPTLGGMIDFLRFHESHPPSFYILLRGWQQVAGTSDSAMLAFVSVGGALIVPVAYVTSQRLFSHRVALFAATFVAFSPSLTEHSAQIRPYGLLPVLVLTSTYFLITALRDGGVRRWICYSLSTALLLYTHNWTWLVLGGEIVAGAIILLPARGIGGRRTLEFAAALLATALLYAPWLSSLVFQVVHAGHTAPPLNNLLDRVAFMVLGIATVPYMLLLGTYPSEKAGLVLMSAGVAILAIILFRFRPSILERLKRAIPESKAERAYPDALRLLLLVPASTLAAAFILSPRSNLVLERCLAMLTPSILIAIAYGLCKLSRSGIRAREQLTIAAVCLIVAISVVSDFALMPTVRSNAREAAKSVAAAIAPDDLLIVAPEWYAPSFNHYFPPLVEQIDYPHAGRSGLLDFADVRTRALDTTATVRLHSAIAAARARGRRVWLVSARRYVQYIDEELPKLTTEEQRNRYTSVLRVKEARDALVAAYGAPDTTHFVSPRISRYEEILPMLFTPHTRLSN